MSDYHRPTDKAVECAISDCEFAASDIDALAVPIGKMTLRHVVEEVKAVRTKLAAAEADLEQTKREYAMLQCDLADEVKGMTQLKST